MTMRIAEQLRQAAADLQADRISVGTLLRAHGQSANGSLLLLLAVPCLLPIPGTGTVLGLGVLAMAVAMWRGQPDAALPRRVVELEMSRTWAQRVLSSLATIYGWAARLTRVRLGWALAAPAHRGIAASVGAMAVVLILPIPFGNVLPALALVLIGLGSVFRDGLPVVLGVLTAVSTASLMLALLILTVAWGGDWAAQLLS
jgi:hypothetical protein